MNEPELKELIKIRKLLELMVGKKASEIKDFMVSDELRKRIREWRSLQVRATNEGMSGQQEKANHARDAICREFKLTIADLVDIAEGRERKSDVDEQPGQ